MPYVYNDRLASPHGTPTALLEDIYVQGGFRVLPTEKQRDGLNQSLCKLGMLVRCLDVNKIFELTDIAIDYDEDYNEIFVNTWQEFKVKPDVVIETASAKPLTRWSLTLRSTLLAPGAIYKLRIPVSRLILVETMSVSHICKVQLKETESLLQLGDGAVFNQILEHKFTDPEKLVFDPRHFFPDGTLLRTRYTKTFMNKDPNIDKYIYYTVENTDTVARNVTAKFLFVSLQLS